VTGKWETLAQGIHQMSVGAFVEKFCDSGHFGSARRAFAEPFETICTWAKEAGATTVVVGGSFVSEKNDPSDIDLLVLFKRARDVRKCQESLLFMEVKLDIQFLAEDQPEILDAFLYMLATGKAGDRRGVVQIELGVRKEGLEIPSVAPIFYEEVLDLYVGRFLQVPIHRNKGVIVPIHGVNTHAGWLPYFSLVAGSSGWGIAPFVYGKERVITLARKRRRDALVQEFREWLDDVRTMHEGPICIFAHSLGSYIFARYLTLMGDIPERFCGVVFAGSIVSANFEWVEYLDSGRVSAVLNTVSSRDSWVDWMREGGFPLLGDPLYGRAGVDGFSARHDRLHEAKIELLNHNNMFQRDVIHSRWIPFFELSLRHYKNARSDRDQWGRG
jgi:hypothetical protein